MQMNTPLHVREARADELFEKYNLILLSYGAPGYTLSYIATCATTVTVVIDLKDRSGAQVKYLKTDVTMDHDLEILEKSLDGMVRFARLDLLRFIK